MSTVSTDETSANADAPASVSRYLGVRKVSDRIAEPLSPEDCVVQSMPDVSPTRWHLAHTTWFFETFLLKPHVPNYVPDHPLFEYLFNSYYNGIGEQFPRAERGLLSRPGLAEVKDYRRRIDERVVEFLDGERANAAELSLIVEIGLNHEQQHQELMLTDIKHVLSRNPLRPAYRADLLWNSPEPGTLSPGRVRLTSGLTSIGYDGDGFCFDNERPRHRVYVSEFELAGRLTTNAEYVEFINDRGYERPELWLSAGWNTVREQGWTAPLYWVRSDQGWSEFSLGGLRSLEPSAPVCHVSYFEADAFARWSGARLPTEAEWEVAAGDVSVEGNLLDFQRLHPAGVTANAETTDESQSSRLLQMYGDVWEWTASQYTAYPGYRPPDGAIGEYNGKFMCNQFVLRGGSCVTSPGHVRPTYRNFFPPDARWQFSGIRLAR